MKARQDLSVDVHPADFDVRLGWNRRLVGLNGFKWYHRTKITGAVRRYTYDTEYTVTVTATPPGRGKASAMSRTLATGPSGSPPQRAMPDLDYSTVVSVSHQALRENPRLDTRILRMGRVGVADGTDGERPSGSAAADAAGLLELPPEDLVAPEGVSFADPSRPARLFTRTTTTASARRVFEVARLLARRHGREVEVVVQHLDGTLTTHRVGADFDLALISSHVSSHGVGLAGRAERRTPPPDTERPTAEPHRAPTPAMPARLLVDDIQSTDSAIFAGTAPNGEVYWRVGHPLPQGERRVAPVDGVAAMYWMASRTPPELLDFDNVPDAQRRAAAAFAAMSARLHADGQATQVERVLQANRGPAVRRSQSLPPDLPLGSRIWFTDGTRSGAAQVESHGRLRVFRNFRRAVAPITRDEFESQHGPGHVFVVTAPVAADIDLHLPEPPPPGTGGRGRLARVAGWGAVGPVPTEVIPGWSELVYRYRAAPDTGAGLDLILPTLLDQPHLHRDIAGLVEHTTPDQPHHADLIRAIGSTLAGNPEATVDIVRHARVGMTAEQRLDWIDRIQQLPVLGATTRQALNDLLLTLIQCTSSAAESGGPTG